MESYYHWTHLFRSWIRQGLPGPRFGFATAENLSRIMVIYQTSYNQPYDFTLSLVEYPWLMEVVAWGTLVLELGFLLTILLGVTITPIVLGIYAFQTGIALSLGILFADVYPIQRYSLLRIRYISA